MEINDLYKILLSDKPSVLIREHENEIFSLIPELEVCKGFLQNNEWHIYDVYEHILHVIDETPPVLELRLAALFHDIGKPLTYTEDEFKVGHFYKHWEVSKNIFASFAEKYEIDPNIIKVVSNLIFYHDIDFNKTNEKLINLVYSKLGLLGITMLFKLKRADLLAQNEKYHMLLSDIELQSKKVLEKNK
jgi:tRNA nucleotidyltransferase (CCA-adding enzyme)